MIGAGELYDLEGEISYANKERLQVMVQELVSELHRLRHLTEEIMDWRRSKEHDEIMRRLDTICESKQ